MKSEKKVSIIVEFRRLISFARIESDGFTTIGSVESTMKRVLPSSPGINRQLAASFVSAWSESNLPGWTANNFHITEHVEIKSDGEN